MFVRTPVDVGLMIRESRRTRRMTQHQLARAAGVGRQWIVAIEAGKPRAELGKVLQTLAALDLSLSIRGEGIPDVSTGDAPIEAGDIDAVVEAHRRAQP